MLITAKLIVSIVEHVRIPILFYFIFFVCRTDSDKMSQIFINILYSSKREQQFDKDMKQPIVLCFSLFSLLY